MGRKRAWTRLSPAVLPPLVGRDEELEFLLARWEQVKKGRGQVVLLSGEAGIGKSRLVHMLQAQVATSLSRLLQTQGKAAAARTLLSEVYGWFTEGFDTADLQEARALLETFA